MTKMMVVELESDGFRMWSDPMPESVVSEFITESLEMGYTISDVDFAVEA